MSEELEPVDQERIDRTIWSRVGKDPVSSIAKATGLKPEEVLRRKNELLTNVDVLTIQQKRQKLLIELDEMAADARETAKSMPSEFYAGTINASVSAIKTMLGELNRMESKDSAAVDRLNSLRLKEITRLIDQVVILSVREIAAEHDLDEDALMEVFQDNLVRAAQEIEE